jgi:hypothetical protein
MSRPDVRSAGLGAVDGRDVVAPTSTRNAIGAAGSSGLRRMSHSSRTRGARATGHYDRRDTPLAHWSKRDSTSWQSWLRHVAPLLILGGFFEHPAVAQSPTFSRVATTSSLALRCFRRVHEVDAFLNLVQ